MPATPRSPGAPIPLVSVNGQVFTSGDLDPTLRQELESLDNKLAESRAKVLELQINTVLLEVEARKRHISAQQLYDLEVTKHIPQPTPAEVKKFIEDNQSQFEGADPKEAARQAAVFLSGERENKLSNEFVGRLRKTNPVTMLVDVNSPNLTPDTVVATIGGQPMKAALLLERLKPIVYNLRLGAYDETRKAAERMVDDTLLLAEANRRKIGPEEIVRTEISDKVHHPTEAEVAKFYSEHKASITGDLDSVRNQLVTYLQDQEQQRLEKDLSARLRKSADIRWLIGEPPQPVQVISVDDDPARGDVNAPVTIVEFTDFQCPACAAMQPVLEEVLKSYGNRIRFVVRDFPLAQHENAGKAAEAADAANAQGKFFEYTAILFKNQKALDVASLKKYASQIDLNRARFDTELDKGIYAAEIKHDIEDGEIYGVGSTPTIFINGVKLRTLSADDLRAAIEKAAARPKTGAPQ
jgi:protein-disulfide isomerase